MSQFRETDRAIQYIRNGNKKFLVHDFKGAISAAKHPAILLIDAIASFGCERIEMDPCCVIVGQRRWRQNLAHYPVDRRCQSQGKDCRAS